MGGRTKKLKTKKHAALKQEKRQRTVVTQNRKIRVRVEEGGQEKNERTKRKRGKGGGKMASERLNFLPAYNLRKKEGFCLATLDAGRGGWWGGRFRK